MDRATEQLQGSLFPRLDRRLTPGPLAETAVVAVAERGGAQLGAALAHVRPDLQLGEVLSVAVHPDARRRGTGTALLAGVERALASRTTAVQGVWRSDWKQAAAIERMLWKAGWDPPREHKLLYKPDAVIYGLPWVSESRAPQGYAVADWDTLTAADRAEIARLVALDPSNADVDPLKNPGLASPTVSVWLRHDGHVVGWMRTNRRLPALVEYAALYVAPEHRRADTARALLAESLRRQRAEQAETPRGIFAVAPTNRTMRTLARRWFGDQGDVRATVWMAGHRLTTE